jgi:hypothetical protein
MIFDPELMSKLKADEPKREVGVCVKFKNEAGYGFLDSMTIPAPNFSFTSEIASTKYRLRSAIAFRLCERRIRMVECGRGR